jgi:hypothetical protein
MRGIRVIKHQKNKDQKRLKETKALYRQKCRHQAYLFKLKELFEFETIAREKIKTCFGVL